MRQYAISLEPVNFLLRIHEADCAAGSMPWPYVGVIGSVTFDEDRVATLRGLTVSKGAHHTPPDGCYGADILAAVGDKLSTIGATGLLWRRIDGRLERVALSGDGKPVYL